MKTRLILILMLPLLTVAQEPVYMEAATQPAVGLGYLRTRFTHRSLDGRGDEAGGSEQILAARYTYGVRYNVSLNVETAGRVFHPDNRSAETGLDDPRLFAKWRILQNDLGPVNTVRGSLLGGIELPIQAHSLSSDSADPFAGGVFTAILGRHGLNAAAQWQFNTGSGKDSADELAVDGSWLYRLTPVRWKADTKASFYTVLEISSRFREDGDRSVHLAPGLLYEARSWAVEAAVRLPLAESLDHRRHETLAVTVGFRRLF